MWTDSDRSSVPKPKEHFSGLYSDAIEQLMVRPAYELFSPKLPQEAVNVNAVDEVPSSSWFTNRIGLYPMTPQKAARGACGEPPLEEVPGPWEVVRTKEEGVTPGLFIEAPDGHRYLLKVDGLHRPLRGTTASVVVSKIYHAVGYHAPCNEIAVFDPSVLVIGPEAVAEDERGVERPLVQSDVEAVLSKAYRLADGRVRVSASRFLPGEPLGPYPLSGTRPDDPNDVVPHEDRRELRGLKLLAAWVGHFDVREQNSLDMWVKGEGGRYVRHYQLDFGDSFGSPWTDDRRNVRVGHSYFLDLEQIFVDTVTLGLLDRPWFDAKLSEQGHIFGYFGWDDFVPSKWRPVYPNPGFERMTWRDALWMVRILSRFTDEHVRAVVATARLPKDAEDFLIRALIERRDRILREYLTRYVPLARFRLERAPGRGASQRLCFVDLAVRHAGVPFDEISYEVRLYGGRDLDVLLGQESLELRGRKDGESCVALPWGAIRPSDLAPKDAAPAHPLRYAVIEVEVLSPTFSSEEPRVVAIHVYDLGAERGFALVGVERLDKRWNS